MQVRLSKESDVPLRQQLAEQIVFLITTGQLKEGDELPSVRALGRQISVHHNTVSEAYQELVIRGWLARRRGRSLVVGRATADGPVTPHDLDQLINESIQRARDLGYSLQTLRLRVRDRLLAQPPDHILIVEEEPGLREIIVKEVHEGLGWPVQSCSLDEFEREPGLGIGAQVLIANHLVKKVEPLISRNRPAIGMVYSRAAEHRDLIAELSNPSVISVVSVSESLLKTARSLLAPAIGGKHSLNEVLVVSGRPTRLGSADVIFCDSIAFSKVRSRCKVHYRLVASDCLEDLAASVSR